MNRFCITLQHDAGRIAIETTGSTWQAALRAVLSFEGAPVSAVLAIADHGAIA
jgi:hypothetical protein